MRGGAEYGPSPYLDLDGPRNQDGAIRRWAVAFSPLAPLTLSLLPPPSISTGQFRCKAFREHEVGVQISLVLVIICFSQHRRPACDVNAGSASLVPGSRVSCVSGGAFVAIGTLHLGDYPPP